VPSEATVARNIHGSRADDLVLLIAVDSMAGGCERCRCSIANFNEYQTVAVEHDQIDLTTAAVKVACDGTESPTDQVLKGQLLCALAYLSC